MNVSNELRLAARKYADRPAIIDGNRVLTHRELDEAAMALARRFLADGLVPGERVAVHGFNSVDVVITILGCFHAGLVAVPINVRFKGPEIAYVLKHCQPRFCYSHPKLSEVVTLVQPEVPTIICTKLPAGLPGPELPVLADDAPGLILYTSGTTAQPKGVTHTQRTLLASAQTMFGVDFDESSVTIVAMSMMHTSGLCASLLPTLLTGGCAVMLPRFDPAELLDLVETHGGTWTLVLPALMQAAAVEQEQRPRNLSSMRVWLCGGDSVPVSLQERWQKLSGRPLLEGYAMSESLLISSNPLVAIRPGSVGRAAQSVQVRIVDTDNVPVPLGTIGEIAVRSPANFIGYWNDPKATERTLIDGWLLTGDRGRMDEDGYIWFQGRLKEIIIRGGSNISPQEVEEVLLQNEAVREAGVVGAPDSMFGERVVAFVVVTEGCSLGEKELREFCRARLADYKVPERILFLSALPKGITGKVQRRALKELARAQSA